MSAASVNYQENQQLEIDRSANKGHYNLIAGYYGGGGYRGGYYGGGGYRGGYYGGGGYRGGYYGGGGYRGGYYGGGGYRGGYYGGGGYRGGYIYNPRGWNYWGWHGGSPWYPNYGYWGGGFWGAFAIGAVTGAIVTAASQPQYYIVQSGTPGYTLLTNYGLTQVRCGVTNLIVINGPSGGVICAFPTNTIPAGSYIVEPSNLTLIPRY